MLASELGRNQAREEKEHRHLSRSEGRRNVELELSSECHQNGRRLNLRWGKAFGLVTLSYSVIPPCTEMNSRCPYLRSRHRTHLWIRRKCYRVRSTTASGYSTEYHVWISFRGYSPWEVYRAWTLIKYAEMNSRCPDDRDILGTRNDTIPAFCTYPY